MITAVWATPIPEDARRIREQIFVQEQGFCAQTEFDSLDDTVEHIVLYDGTQPIATGRVIDDGDGVFHFGRIAIIKAYRGSGLGRFLMRHLEQKALQLGAKIFLVGAQVRAQDFYEKCGYRCCGAEYMDEHVPHVSMKKNASF